MIRTDTMEYADSLLRRYQAASERLRLVHGALQAVGWGWDDIRKMPIYQRAERRRNRVHLLLNSPVGKAA